MGVTPRRPSPMPKPSFLSMEDLMSGPLPFPPNVIRFSDADLYKDVVKGIDPTLLRRYRCELDSYNSRRCVMDFMDYLSLLQHLTDRNKTCENWVEKRDGLQRRVDIQQAEIYALTAKNDNLMTSLAKKQELECIHPEGIICEHDHWRRVKREVSIYKTLTWMFGYLFGLMAVMTLAGYMR